MLPAETARVWDFLKQQTGMYGFILIGGSALSLRINHRISEDLDVAFRGNCLPSAWLKALVRSHQVLVKRRKRQFEVAGLAWIVERTFAWIG